MPPILDKTPHTWLCSIHVQGEEEPVVLGRDNTDAVQMEREVMDIALANKLPGQHVWIGMRALDTDPITLQ